MSAVPKFTGLALITGESSAIIEPTILETLAPFSLKIIDKQSMDIRGRFFLAILFTLDKAHAKAIERDLEQSAAKLQVDLAVDFRDFPVES